MVLAHRAVYGIDRLYPMSAQDREAWRALTGRRTVELRDVPHLETLGVSVEVTGLHFSQDME